MNFKVTTNQKAKIDAQKLKRNEHKHTTKENNHTTSEETKLTENYKNNQKTCNKVL